MSALSITLKVSIPLFIRSSFPRGKDEKNRNQCFLSQSLYSSGLLSHPDSKDPKEMPDSKVSIPLFIRSSFPLAFSGDYYVSGKKLSLNPFIHQVFFPTYADYDVLSFAYANLESQSLYSSGLLSHIESNAKTATFIQVSIPLFIRSSFPHSSEKGTGR